MPKDNPLINKHARLKECPPPPPLPLAIDENNWMDCIDAYSCRNIVNLNDLNPENVNEPENEKEVEKEVEPEETDPGAHAEASLSPSPLSFTHNSRTSDTR